MLNVPPPIDGAENSSLRSMMGVLSDIPISVVSTFLDKPGSKFQVELSVIVKKCGGGRMCLA